MGGKLSVTSPPTPPILTPIMSCQVDEELTDVVVVSRDSTLSPSQDTYLSHMVMVNPENLEINSGELQRISADLRRLPTGSMSIKRLRVHFGPALVDEHEFERLINLPHFQLETVSVGIDCSKWKERQSTATLLERNKTLKEFWMPVDSKLAAESQSHFLARNKIGHSLNLTELLLLGYTCLFPDFHFLEQLPHLKVLQLGKCLPKMLKGTVFKRLEMFASLPHLYYFEIGLTLSAEAMTMFVKVMPKVEILKTCLTTEAFRVVCRKWRHLRELHLRSLSDISTKDAVGDEGLTGIVEGCDLLLSNIIDLKYLQCLCIRSKGKISDTSVWNGFLELPNLRRLTVALEKETSEEALAALLTRFPTTSGSKITRKGSS